MIMALLQIYGLWRLKIAREKHAYWQAVADACEELGTIDFFDTRYIQAKAREAFYAERVRYFTPEEN